MSHFSSLGPKVIIAGSRNLEVSVFQIETMVSYYLGEDADILFPKVYAVSKKTGFDLCAESYSGPFPETPRIAAFLTKQVMLYHPYDDVTGRIGPAALLKATKGVVWC